MNTHLQSLCKVLVDKLDKADESQKSRIRNELFCAMYAYLIRWIMNSLKKRGVFLDKEEIVSCAWDAFEYCLKTYKNKSVPLPSHFSKNIDYFVLKCLKRRAKEEGKVIVDSDLKEFVVEEDFDFNEVDVKVINPMDFLLGYRGFLPEEYRNIFDDVITGKEECHTKNKSIAHYKRKEAKKIIRQLIYYVLKIGE